MSKQLKYLIPQDVSIVFYALILLFVLTCLVFSGRFFQLQKDLYFKQRSELIKLQRQVTYNTSANNNQNFSITEIEKRLNILEEK